MQTPAPLSPEHILQIGFAFWGSKTLLSAVEMEIFTELARRPGTLDIVVRSGRARYIGCSNFQAWQVARALGKSEARGLARFATVQPRYNLLFRQIERELLPLCLEEGVGVLPYNPLAGGLLSGKHDRSQAPPEGTRFTLGTATSTYQDRYWHEREFETVSALADVSKESGIPLVTLAIAWVLANPAVTSPIIGASRAEQLAASVAAADVQLDAELRQRLDDLTRDYRLGDAAR